jgi:hypothetical protein
MHKLNYFILFGILQFSFMNASLEKIAKAAEGLYFISETDAPFEIVQFSTTTEDGVLKQIQGSDKKVEKQTVDYFFRNHVKEYPEHGEREKLMVQKFHALINALKSNLSDLQVYRVGDIQVDAYIIGRLEDGSYAGLKTKLVET